MLKRYLEQVPPWIAGVVILGVFVACVLFEPSQTVGQYSTDAGTEYGATYHYSPETWAAIVAAIFSGALAIAAFIQIAETRRSAERQQRAYVLIETSEFGVPKTAGGNEEPWYVHIVFKNFGQTPAHFSVVKAMLALGTPKPVDTLLELTSEATVYSEATIPPGNTHTVRVRCLDNGLADYLARRATGDHAYIWGRIDYIDIFGGKNFTEFQMVQVFGQLHQFAFCNKGNRTEARRPDPPEDGQDY